jgi:uncharacterized integral membrane protein (TIGR00697 family)
MKKYSFTLTLISMVSVVACLAANLISARTGFLFGQVVPMGVFFFPLIYVISDVISDVYGYRISRFVAWGTLLMNILFTFGIVAVINGVTPTDAGPESIDAALRTILTPSAGVLMAGIVGAVVGGWFNDIVFQVFRHNDGVGKFVKRKLISSCVAEIVDTCIFIPLAFGVFIGLPWAVVGKMTIVQFTAKYLVEVITAPIAKFCANKLRAVEGEEVFEDRNKFNIFGFYKH